MRTMLLLASAAVLVGIASMVDAQPDARSGPRPDDEFAKAAALSNLFEIESSRLALERSQDQDVRAFAQRMVEDHTRAGVEMKAAAGKDGVFAVPTGLDEAHRRKIEALRGADGPEFDRLYLDMQQAAHQDAVALFDAQAKGEGALARFAQETLPVLRQHREAVRALLARKEARP